MAQSTPPPSLSGHLMNVVKSFIGSNYLAVPHVFLLGGVYFSCFGMAFIAVLTGFCCSLLVQVRQVLREKGNVPCTTYGQVAMSVLGWKGYALVEAAVLLTQTGFCIGYLIFMSTAAQHLIGIEFWQVCFILAVPLTAVACVRELSSFTSCSYVANLALLISFLLIAGTDINGIQDHGFKNETTIDLERLPIFFGVLIACFEGIGTVLPVEGAMGSQRDSYVNLLWIVMIGITILFSTFGILGVGRYGDDICGIILDNLNSSYQSDIIKICIIIGLFFTYAFQLFPVTEILEGKWASYLDKLENKDIDTVEGNAGNPKLNDSRVPLLTAFDDCKDVEKDVDAYLASDTASNSSYTATESLLESMKDGHERSSSDSIDLAPLGVKYSLSREFSVDVQCSNDHKARYRLLGLNRVVALRICMVLLTVVIAIAVPQFELLISFVGSLGAAFLAFIVPCLLAERVLNPTTLQIVGLRCILCLGVVFTILGTSLSLMGIVESLVFHKTESCG